MGVGERFSANSCKTDLTRKRCPLVVALFKKPASVKQAWNRLGAVCFCTSGEA